MYGFNPQTFEARIINGENPGDILVQRKTAFIDLTNCKLYIKDLNGDMKWYDIVIPKTPEQIENEQLKQKLREMEMRINELSINKSNSEIKQQTSDDIKFDKF